MKKSQSGLSLIELMIAMVLGLLVIAAVGGVFVASSRNYRQDDRMTKMQSELQFALAAVAQEVELAGFWAETLNPASITLDPSLNDPGCGPAGVPGWVYTDRFTPVRGVDNATPAAAAAAFPCIDAAQFQPGTDVLAIKRVAGRTATGGTQGAFLRANASNGVLLVGTAPAIPAPPDQFWEYEPSVFYVRNFSATAGDGIPTLCREVLQGAMPSFTAECFAAGIEDFQVEYGLDLDSDGFADRFTSTPAANQFRRVSEVRISMLVRSERPMQGYTNAKSYQLGNAPVRTPNDNFYRRMASITIAVRNPASLRVLLG